MDKINSIRWSREEGAWNINLIPFSTFFSQLQLLKRIPTIAIKNIVGNIIIFVPFGFLFPMGYETMRQYRKTFFAGLAYILVIELVQFICMLGTFDVDDIILNSIGVFCGYVIFKMILKKMETGKTTVK